MVICLGVILFEILFVFSPSARSIEATTQKLSESGKKSKTMELGALFGSLEEAYQDLVGNVSCILERFAELMAFGDAQPDNLLDWLNGQLGKSIRTIETHRFNIMKKLKVNNVVELLKKLEDEPGLKQSVQNL